MPTLWWLLRTIFVFLAGYAAAHFDLVNEIKNFVLDLPSVTHKVGVLF
jgi:hypothetical protein